MDKYKHKLYKKYVSTHISTNKGKPSLEEFKHRSVVYTKQFGNFLPDDKDAKIVDLGCGSGSIVWWLHNLGYSHAMGIDISAEQIEVGKELGINNIEQQDIKVFLENKKDFYNLIFARDVLEHFKKEEIVEILSYCYAALQGEGVMIIQVPNAESPFGGRIRYGDFTHEIAFTSSSLSQILLSAGFKEVNVYPAEPVVFNAKTFVRFFLWKIVEFLYKFLLFTEIGRTKSIVTQNIIAVAKK